MPQRFQLLGHKSRIFDCSFAPSLSHQTAAPQTGAHAGGGDVPAVASELSATSTQRPTSSASGRSRGGDGPHQPQQLLATSSEDSCVRLWDVARRRCVSVLSTSPEDEVLRVAWSRNARLVAAGTALGKVYLWNNPRLATQHSAHTPTTGAPKGTQQRHPPERIEPLDLGGQIYACEFNPDVEHRVVVGAEDCLREIDIETRQTLWTWHVPPMADDEQSGPTFGGDRNPDKTDFVFDSSFAPGGQILAAAASDGTIRLVDRRSVQEVLVLQGHDRFVTSCVFKSQQHGARKQLGGALLLGSTSGDATVCLWDARMNAQCLFRFGDNRKTIFGCCFSNTGNELVTCSADGTVHAYDVGTGECVKELAFGNYSMLGLDMDEQGTLALCGGQSVVGGTPAWVVTDALAVPKKSNPRASAFAAAAGSSSDAPSAAI